MGIELVKLIVARHGARLSGNAHKVLVAMAVVALDRANTKGQTPRLYFGGWEPLALALGADPARGKAAYEPVRRALKELENKGLIERLHEARKGVRQTFRIDLAAFAEPLQNVGALDLQNVGALDLQNVGHSPYETLPPRKETGVSEDLDQDCTTHPSASTTDRARNGRTGITIRASEPHDFEPDLAGLYCQVCELPESHERHQTWRAA